MIPGETHDLFVLNAPPDVYLRSVWAGNEEVLAYGLKAEQGDSPQPLEVLLSGNGGQVLGQVSTRENTIASGANVMLLPDAPRGRIQYYQSAWADGPRAGR